jgi:antitoxin VapB
MPEITKKRAKLFRNGRSQAVRLPKEFRFSGHEVTVQRSGDGVLLEPVRSGSSTGDWDWVREWREKFGPLDADFIAAVEEEMPAQERPEVDRYFAALDERYKRDGV